MCFNPCPYLEGRDRNGGFSGRRAFTLIAPLEGLAVIGSGGKASAFAHNRRQDDDVLQTLVAAIDGVLLNPHHHAVRVGDCTSLIQGHVASRHGTACVRRSAVLEVSQEVCAREAEHRTHRSGQAADQGEPSTVLDDEAGLPDHVISDTPAVGLGARKHPRLHVGHVAGGNGRAVAVDAIGDDIPVRVVAGVDVVLDRGSVPEVTLLCLFGFRGSREGQARDSRENQCSLHGITPSTRIEINELSPVLYSYTTITRYCQ